MATESKNFALWLLPDRDTQRWASRQILSLASQLRGARFAPHVTVASGFGSAGKARAALGAAAAVPDALEVVGQRTGEPPFETLVVDLVANPEFAALSQACEEAGARVPEVPHLSLYYGPHSAAVDAACSALRGVPERFAFERIEVWDVGGAVENWHAS